MVRSDKNRDGRISREKLSMNHFLLDRVDADQDGIIAPAEPPALPQRAFPEPTGR